MVVAAPSSRVNPPLSRRTPPSTSPTPPSPSTARGVSARSAASPRVSSSLNSTVTRRSSLKVPPPSHAANGETRESLSASLKYETEQKERLMVQLQNKDQTISNLTTENDNLSSVLSAAETRLNELYAEQSRTEVDLAQRIDISDNLRAQVRELEKEKRDVQRRYNEQTITFEAERQAFYDNEQHLKSRIQSLSQARKQPDPTPSAPEPDNEPEPEQEEDVQPIRLQPQRPKQDLNDPETEPAEMTSLKLELSTLSTSYSSLQSTLVLLQTQLVDLKRVNHELQEENESYMILLREKTLSGQYDLMKQVGSVSSESSGDEDDGDAESADVGSLRSIGRSTLDRVEEMPEDSLEQELERSLDLRDTDSHASRNSRHPGRQGRKHTSTSHSPSNTGRGETLADLPITGPGLDLAAELGRAENKDILAENSIEDRDRSIPDGKGKRSKKGSDTRKASSSEDTGLEPSGSTGDIAALRTEVKSLKDANKALSLYASKIIDRIISQEGFEHVLAVDYEKEPPTPSTAGPQSKTAKAPPPASQPPPLPPPPPPPKRRPQSVIVGRSTSNPIPTPDTSRLNSPPLTAAPKLHNPPNPKSQRRSLSFDWKSFSLFNAEKKPDPSLRPLTLKPGSVTGARKLDTQEDEEDRRERERLNATMKLMGIQPPQSPSPPTAVPMQKTISSPAAPQVTGNNRRFSFFGTKTATDTSDTSSVHSTHDSGNSRFGLGIEGSSNLTQEALEHAEAENSLAALDAHERSLSAEIAKGASGGFTEIAPRHFGGRRSRRSAGGSDSGSTVWSAGMGGGDEGDD